MLTEALNVSHVTLRKDLDKLESRGIIKCTHGHASLEGVCKGIAFYYPIKQKIAKAAVQTVEEGETIMLESGSCCAIFAEELALARKNNTIITNSAFIANYICDFSNTKVILLGGLFQPDSQVAVGRMTINCAKNVFFDKFFLGTDGFIPGQGFTGMDYLRVQTAIGIIKRTNKVFILTEAAKFNRRGTFNLVQLDKLAGVFTDDSIPKEAEKALLQKNVKLYKVSAAEEKIKWQKIPGMPPILYTTKE